MFILSPFVCPQRTRREHGRRNVRAPPWFIAKLRKYGTRLRLLTLLRCGASEPDGRKSARRVNGSPEWRACFRSGYVDCVPVVCWNRSVTTVPDDVRDSLPREGWMSSHSAVTFPARVAQLDATVCVSTRNPSGARFPWRCFHVGVGTVVLRGRYLPALLLRYRARLRAWLRRLPGGPHSLYLVISRECIRMPSGLPIAPEEADAPGLRPVRCANGFPPPVARFRACGCRRTTT